MRKEIKMNNATISIHGDVKNVARAEKMINDLGKLQGWEGGNRALIQKEVCDKVRCSILYNGNTIYPLKAILKDFKKVIEGGVECLSDELYTLFHCSMGTIAHYNKQGWISNYPTISDVRGVLVNAFIPDWHTDLELIRSEMILMIGRKR